MKRSALLLLFVFPMFYYPLSAQTFRAGFYIGAAVTDVDGTDNIDNDNDFKHLGFTVAGTVSVKISPKTNLQMEIRFIQKGAQQSPQFLNDSASTPVINPSGQYLNNYFTMILNYVDVVVGVKRQIHFNLRNKATDRYGIEGGVSVGSLVSYSYQVNSMDTKLAVNTLDISPYVGIYYNVTPHFYVEGRYSNSINSVLVHDNVQNPYFLYYGSYNAGHNLAFTMTLGFEFGGTPSTDKESIAAPTDN